MSKVKEAIDLLKEMDYSERSEIYKHTYSLGYFSSDTVTDKVALVSLVSLLYIKLKEKDNTVTPLKILLKITKQEEDGSFFYQMLETLSIMVEDFSYNCKKSHAFGLKNSQEIINKIKEILSAWIPF